MLEVRDPADTRSVVAEVPAMTSAEVAARGWDAVDEMKKILDSRKKDETTEGKREHLRLRFDAWLALLSERLERDPRALAAAEIFLRHRGFIEENANLKLIVDSLRITLEATA
jgi:hypothetical protein